MLFKQELLQFMLQLCSLSNKVNQNLKSYLLVEAPPPDQKLAMLSEIAQEHNVMWDAALAAREMLPPAGVPETMAQPSAMGNGQGPPPPQTYPSQQQQFSFPPPNMPYYADASQAAAAAAHAASQAKAAADYAAQFAMFQAGVAPPLPLQQQQPAATAPTQWQVSNQAGPSVNASVVQSMPTPMTPSDAMQRSESAIQRVRLSCQDLFVLSFLLGSL